MMLKIQLYPSIFLRLGAGVAPATGRMIGLWLGLLFWLHSAGQPGALDLSFQPALTAIGEVSAIALQPDGKIITGSTFNTFFAKLNRLQKDGSLDTSFVQSQTTNGYIRTIALQPDGKVLVGGDFNQFDSAAAPRLFRLHPNGSLDTTFNIGTGFNSPVYSVALQPDGKIMAGGMFTELDGVACQRLVRLHADGSLDTSFQTKLGANGTIEKIVLQPDGKIMIGGDFTAYDSTASIRISRVKANGRIDSSFVAIPGASAVVFDMALQPDGKVIIGGNINLYNFQPRPKYLRLNTDGGIDPSFAVNQGANSRVQSVHILNDGRVLLGGGFTTIRDLNIPRLALLSNDGTPDTLFNDTGTGANESVKNIEIQQDGKIIIAGLFTSYNNVTRLGIARLYNCQTPQPDSIFGSSYALCSGAPQVYTTNPVAGATLYAWTLPNGWTGSSNTNSITITSNGTGGILSVRAFTDSCGFSAATSRSIATLQPPSTPICLVTVDTASTQNIVLWEKPQTGLIDSFIIYREITTNNYSRIAAVPYNSLSEYRDTAANPNVTSYRYKLSVLDTCGAESDLSAYHNTIHLQHFGLGNFQWTFYQIQNQLNPVLSFNVYRDNFGTGNFLPIGNIPGTNATFTDITYASYPNSVYVVDANWSISCDPTRAVNTTRSNIKKIKEIDFPIVGSLLEADLTRLNVFPNPASDRVQLSVPENITVRSIRMVNALGQTVGEYGAVSSLLTDHLAAGVYYLHFDTNAGRTTRKIMLTQ